MSEKEKRLSLVSFDLIDTTICHKLLKHLIFSDDAIVMKGNSDVNFLVDASKQESECPASETFRGQ